MKCHKLKMELAVLLALCCLSVGWSALFSSKKIRIAVDYGPRLIGLAHTDFLGNTIPYCTLRNRGNLTEVSESIARCANRFRASEIIVGVPLDSNGRLDYNVKNINAKICLNFSIVLASILQEYCKFPHKVLLFDERYTTQEAKLRTSRRQMKGILISTLHLTLTQHRILMI
jgi:RNase H-fold protein (predicted Holliday junction resolvase)